MNDLLIAPTEEGVDMILDHILEIGGTNLQGKLNSYCPYKKKLEILKFSN